MLLTPHRVPVQTIHTKCLAQCHGIWKWLSKYSYCCYSPSINIYSYLPLELLLTSSLLEKISSIIIKRQEEMFRVRALWGYLFKE